MEEYKCKRCGAALKGNYALCGSCLSAINKLEFNAGRCFSCFEIVEELKEGTVFCDYCAGLTVPYLTAQKPNDYKKENDPVAHPNHYTKHPSGIECIEVTQHHNFCVGNAIKYLWRCGLKGGEEKRIEDLKKAKQYIKFEIKRLKGE